MEVLPVKDLEHSAGFGKMIRSILRSVKIRDKHVSLFDYVFKSQHMSSTSNRNLSPLVHGIFESGIILNYIKYFIIRTWRMTFQVTTGSAFYLVLMNWLHIGTKQKNINGTESTGLYMLSHCFIYCSILSLSLIIVNIVYILGFSMDQIIYSPFFMWLCNMG